MRQQGGLLWRGGGAPAARRPARAREARELDVSGWYLVPGEGEEGPPRGGGGRRTAETPGAPWAAHDS